MISERVVLFGVQYFEHSSRWITVVIRCANLVNLVQQEDGVRDSNLLESTDNETWHSRNVSPAVSTDLCFVSNATEGYSVELAAKCSRDGLGQAGLSYTWWTNKKQDRRFVDHALPVQDLGLFGRLFWLLLLRFLCIIRLLRSIGFFDDLVDLRL